MVQLFLFVVFFKNAILILANTKREQEYAHLMAKSVFLSTKIAKTI